MNYKQYGESWEKEIAKLPKHQIVKMLKDSYCIPNKLEECMEMFTAIVGKGANKSIIITFSNSQTDFKAVTTLNKEIFICGSKSISILESLESLMQEFRNYIAKD